MGRPEGPALVLAVVCVVAGLAASTGDASVHADLQEYVTTRTASYRDLSAFSFGVYSDIHMIENVDFGLTRTQWAKLLTQWRDAGHLFGMIVGDLGYGNATDPANVLSGPAAVAGAPPVFYAMGNHETDGIGKRAWVDALYPGAVQSASWTSRSGLIPGNGDHVYYSFDVGPSTHFIVLDGDYVTYDGITTVVRQRFGQAQLTWLAADIQANSNRNILVFVHEPIDQQVTGSTPEFTLNDKGGLIDLLAAHPKQAFVFSGHFHSLTGITQWKGIKSVHVMARTLPFYGSDYYYGVNVSVKGDQISITNAGAVTDFDQHPMNQVQTVGDKQVVSVAEDGANSGLTRNARMSVVGPENGIVPTSGSLMLKGPAMTWYAPRFISEQFVKIRPGMKFSFDMFLLNVVGADDAVTVQPHWYMKDGSIPPRVVDQNGFQLSQRPRDGMYFLYNDDVPRLGGLATGRWYHREFDLSALAGNYVDGIYLTSGATRVNVGAVYVDNIRFTWPASTTNAAPSVTLTSPGEGASFTAPASIGLTASASDADGSITQVRFFAGATQVGSSTSAPFAATWSNVAAGSYTLTATATDNAGATTTSAPVHVTVAAPVPNSSTSAVFLATDTTTRGSWKGVYGKEGYSLANDATSLPAYATVTQQGSLPWTWAASTTDVRALQKAATADRLAATWYGTSLTLDVKISDGLAHKVSLYLLDWDARGRSETIQLVDASTGLVLDSRSAAAFSGGQYYTWAVTGRVLIRVTLTGGPNALYSALFFDR